MGVNWWTFNPELNSSSKEAERREGIAGLRERIEALEATVAREPAPPAGEARG